MQSLGLIGPLVILQDPVLFSIGMATGWVQRFFRTGGLAMVP